jgi:hypothetical protein
MVKLPADDSTTPAMCNALQTTPPPTREQNPAKVAVPPLVTVMVAVKSALTM